MIKRKIRPVLCSVVLLLITLACGPAPKEYTYSNYLFGSQCSIKFYYIGDERAREIIDVIDLELTRLDSLLNYFSDQSLVSELNRKLRVQAPGDIIYLVNVCDSVSRLTDGLFDITVAPLLEIWGFYHGEKKIPGPDELARAKRFVGFRRVRITTDSIVIDPGMRVDFGGIAQGYAADRAGLILRQRHVKSAIIDIGGEILAVGRSPQMRPWRVGIRNPRGQGIIEAVELQDSAVSTSGDYEKFFIMDSRRYPHIINPHTGLPAQEFASVSVFAKTATLADAMATATAIMGRERGIEFLDSLGFGAIIYYEENGMLERVSTR